MRGIQSYIVFAALVGVGSAYAQDELVVPLPQTTASVEKPYDLNENPSTVNIALGVGTRPTLTFYDTFARSSTFRPTNIPSVEASMGTPQMWRAGRFSFGPRFALGLSTWQSEFSQQLYEIPLSASAELRYDLSARWKLLAEAGLRASCYWSSYSIDFQKVSWFGTGFESGLGAEWALNKRVSLNMTALYRYEAMSALYPIETNNSNHINALGLNLGVGFIL